MMQRFALAAMAAQAAATTNSQWVFRKSTHHTNGEYIAGTTIALEDSPMPLEPIEGQLLVRTVASSVIPSYRGRCNPESWPAKADYSPFVLDEPIQIEQVMEVVTSKVEGFAAGDLVHGTYRLSQYQTIMGDGSDSFMPPTKLDPTVPTEKVLATTSLGGGLTSYHVVHNTDIGAVDSPCTKTILITSAGSTVGSIAGQLYKAKGCKVIGATSTKAKAKVVMEQGGFDAIIAYKEEDFAARLNELAPEGIDLDFENVGGTQLDAALVNMNMYGKVIMCGLISDYNKPTEAQFGISGPAAFEIVLKRLRLEGIMVMDVFPVIGEALAAMGEMIAAGSLKSTETVIHGFDRWGEAMDMMLDSKSTGRLVIKTDPASKDEL